MTTPNPEVPKTPSRIADIGGVVKNELGQYLYIETEAENIVLKIRSAEGESSFTITPHNALLIQENIKNELEKCSRYTQRANAKTVGPQPLHG